MAQGKTLALALCCTVAMLGIVRLPGTVVGGGVLRNRCGPLPGMMKH